MKLNKVQIIALLAVGGLLALTTTVLAQDSTNTPPAAGPPAGGHPGGGRMMRAPNIDRMVERLTTTLDLTNDQPAQVKAILEAQYQQINTVRTNTSLAMDDRRSQLMAIRKDSMDKMQAVLTPDQFTQYQQMTMRRRPRPNPGGTNSPAGPPTTPPPPPQQ